MSTYAATANAPDRGRNLTADLTRLFGHPAFRGKQEEVVRLVLAGIDTVAIMPTGAGKSLCYQLPAMLLPGTTLVISPLIALMKDQLDSLPAGVYERTAIINSTLSAEELAERTAEIVSGKYKLVYCAPERLRHQPFVHALAKARISLVVVDEAHCVSMWGHDFRPDYLFIGKCLPQLGRPAVLAMTATSTPQMRAEIAEQLGRKLHPVLASVYRSNLYYEVEDLNDKEAKMRRLVEVCRRERGPGVVYAGSRETCEQLAAMLRRNGVQAAHYHAGMNADERTRTQEMFMLDRVRVIVATIAFGMGIDKSNVRFIVHFSPPDSLEAYVQESGRAGRDGRPARCVLFVTAGDKSNLTRWKRQEQLKVEELRAVYKEITRLVPSASTAFVNITELTNAVRASLDKEFDESQVRVATSLFERVGLLFRHADAPRTLFLQVTAKGAQSDDGDFERFKTAAVLAPGEAARRDSQVVSTLIGTPPDEVERSLLGWADRGWLVYRGERREAVFERLQPPQNVAEAINQLLEMRDEAQQRQIEQMIAYAGTDRCRHQMLAAHLGERMERCQTSCDICSPPLDRPEPETSHAPDLPQNPGQVIVECLASFPFNAGKPSLVKVLKGSAASNITPDRVRHFGALAGASGTSLERAIDQLVEAGYLRYYQKDDFNLLEVTGLGRQGVPPQTVALAAKRVGKKKEGGRQPVAQSERAGAQTRRDGAAQPDLDRAPTPEEEDLFERLRQWRRVVANRLGLPPFYIFHDKTLWAIAKMRPQSEEELLAVKGVGQSQLDKYGADLLALLTEQAEA